MNINVFKFIICISLFLETTLFGFLPLISMKINSEIRIKILGLANAFAGGIFLSSGFIHLLGDNQEILTHELSTEIPIALICCSFGFLLIFFLEKVIFVEYHINHSSVHEENENQPFLKKDTIYGTLESSSTNVLHHNHQNEGHHTHEHISGDPYSNSSLPHHIKVGKITPYILVIVMSIHSFISGIAMGVQSTIENTVPLLIAMVSHKWVESFAVGISLIRFGQTKKNILFLILLYSFMTPIGLFIGSLIMIGINNEKNTLIIEAIGGSIASGTFIYIGAIDIMIEEFSHHRDRYKKLFICLFSFILMSALIFILPHEH